ncbi:hypothetical protein RI129_001802 [Pyrocoelia pectoralis]|uniref:Serpin domain-containing protein n=1 Tax=Pyrocoelia pectoralis TaxID=417401 RepID=A0AAN7VYD8_9COLE
MYLTVIEIRALKSLHRIQHLGNTYVYILQASEISSRKDGNFLVCPLSVQIVLSLATVGARGNTATQLSNCLHLPDNSSEIVSIFQNLSNGLEVDEIYQFTCANRIFLNKKCSIKSEYNDIAVNTFKSSVEGIDFGDNERAAKQINNWVENKTKNKITNLIKKDKLTDDVLAILINALYFHGHWVNEFGKSEGFQKKFYVSEKETALINVMSQRNYFKYCNNEELNAEFLELPFLGNDVAMTFVLPKKNVGISLLEKNILKVISPQTLRLVDAVITIPMFKMESTIEFKEILESLGVTEPFSLQANFEGISDIPIYISDVVQKTFIEINERGATAAAATEMTLMMVSMPQVFFTVDRPFIYYLRHRTNGVFFIGRFSRPE